MDEQLRNLIEGAKKQGATDNDIKKIIDMYIADQKKKGSSEFISQEKSVESPTRTTQQGTSSDTEPPTRAQASVALGGQTANPFQSIDPFGGKGAVGAIISEQQKTATLPSYPVREKLYPGEDKFFKENPNVGGMAAEDQSVILNPYSSLNDKEKQAIITNETARLAMRGGYERPTFELTPEQKQSFKNYSSNIQDQRETIVGRILSGDPSAGNVTPEQKKYAEGLRGVMNLNNKPSVTKKVKTIEEEEEDYFTGGFGNFLRGVDEISPIGIGDFIDDMARSVSSGYRQGTLAEAADKLLLKGHKATPEQIQKFIDANKYAQQMKPSDEMQDYTKTYEEEGKGFWGVVKGIFKNPTVVPELITSSLVGMATNMDALLAGAATIGTGATIGATTGASAGTVALPVVGTVGGAAAGAIAGAEASIPYAFGVASSVVEAGSTFGELLSEELEGKDMTKENVRAILEDPEKLNSIRNKAIARGVIIGTADALTGKLASGVGAKIMTKSAAKSATGAVTKGAVVRATAAGAGVESVGGSLGEATARKAVGQEMDVSEIALEGIAELPGGVRSTIQARLAKPSYRVNGEKVDADQVDQLIDTMTPEQLATTDIKIKNDYTGKEFKIQDKIVTNSIKEDVKKANPDLNEPSLNAITQLEKELQGLEGNKTQTGKDKAAAIRTQIKNIQENQIQEEAVVETAKAEGMSVKAPEKNVFYYYEAKGEKAPTEVPAGYTSMKKVENSEEVKLWNAQKPAEVKPTEVKAEEVKPAEVKEPAIVVHATVDQKGFALSHSEGIAKENILEPRDTRDFTRTATPEQKTEYNKGRAVVQTDEALDNGDKKISIVKSIEDPGGREGGATFDFVIPQGNNTIAENIKQVIDDVASNRDLKGKKLIDETVKQVKNYIDSNKPTETKTAEVKTKSGLDLPKVKDEVNNSPVTDRDENNQDLRRFIPFSIVEEANKNDKLSGQTARQIAQRGGYSVLELNKLLPNWKEMLPNAKPAEEVKPTEAKAEEVKPAIESPIELKEGEELVDVKQDKKGNTYTYVAETSEKDGVKTTKFKFNRSDKSSEQRNPAGVDADKVLDKYGYEIPADQIQEGAEIIEINEIREGEKTTGATVTFKDAETGNTFQGEIVLQPKAKEAKAAEVKPVEGKAEVKTTETKTAEVAPTEVTPEAIAIEEIAPSEIETTLDEVITPASKNIKEQIARAKKAISKFLPNVEIVYHTTAESFKSVVGDNSRGYYDTGTKKIHINGSNATNNTVAHEVFHAVILKYITSDKQATDLTNRMFKALAKSIKNNPKLLKDITKFADSYSKGLQSEEKLAEVLGYLASEYETLPDVSKNIIQKWIEKIAVMLKMKPFTDQEVVDFMNAIATKVAYGQEITEGDVGKVLGKNKILEENTLSGKRKRRQAEDLFLTDKKPKLSSTKDVANFLDIWANENKLFDKDIKDVSDDVVVKEFVNHISAELNAWSKVQGDKYVSFYDEDIAKKANPTLQKYAKENYGRELKDEEVKLFHLVSAFASPSANPYMDSWKGFYIFNRYMKTGELSGYSDKMATVWETLPNKKRVDTGIPKLDSKGNPIRSKVTPAYSQTGIEKFQAILDKNNNDLKKAMDWMTSKHSFKDISDMFGYPLSGPKATKENEYLSKEDGGIGVFGMTGAKLGSYILNRFGNFSTVTKDMWYARTMARLSGEKLVGIDKETGKESAIKTPWAESTKEGKRKRELADKAFKIVADNLGTSPAMVQERIWDFEKRLYEMLGANEDAAYVSDGLNKGIEIANTEAKDTSTDNVKGRKQISPENSSNYANMTEDGKGNFVFYHFGPRGIKSIDPKKYGSNKGAITSKPEIAAMGRVGGMSQFYTMPEYQESNVSGDKYMIKVPMDKVYDFNTDPENLYEKAREMFKAKHPDLPFTANDQLAYITKLAEKAGYDMTVAEWNDMSRAQSTKALKPVDTQVMDGNVISKPFQEDYESNSTKGFESVIPTSKEAKLKDVYQKINAERNAKNRYDSLYSLAEDFPKLSQDKITDMIESSDISQEMKDAYAEALAYEPGTRMSGRRQVDAKAIAKNTKAEVDRVKALPINAEDGATFNLDGTKYEGGGLVVPMNSLEGNTTQDKLSPEMIGDFAKENEDSVGDEAMVKMGIYKFPGKVDVSVDMNIVIPNEHREVALEFGALTGQKSLFDLDTFEYVETGGDGLNTMKLTPEQFREAAASLKNGVMPAFVSGRRQKSPIDTAVETAKRKGFNDKDISDYLVGKGYTRAQATNAILRYNEVTAKKLRKEDSVFTKEGRNKIITFLDQVKRRALSAKSFLPKSVFILKEGIEANIKAEAKRASYLVDDFNKLVKGYKGDLNALNDEFDKYLRGDQTAVLPDEFKVVAGKMRMHIDNLSQMLLRTGAVTVSQAETIAANLGQYINRSYQVFDKKNWAKQVTEEMKEAARVDLRNMYRASAESKAKQTGMDADIILEKFINDKIDELIGGESAATFLGIGKTGSKDLSIMKQRLDIPISIRQLMGEYTDASQNYARTVIKIATLAENARFLQSARDAGMGVFFFKEGDINKPSEFNVQIAGEGSETMNPLNGLFTTKEIADAFKTSISAEKFIEGFVGPNLASSVASLYTNYMKLLSVVKWVKTIASVATHFKNVTGNIWFMLSNGYFNYKKYREAFNVLKNSSNEQLRDKLDEYIRAGIIDQSAALGEIKSMFSDADFDTAIENRLKKNPIEKAKKASRWVVTKLNTAYQLEDDFYKIVSYESEKDRYSNAIFDKPFDQLTTEQQNIIKEKTSEITKNVLANYARIPGLVKLIKIAPVTGTFISFQAEAYRTAWNTVALAFDELNSSNKKIKAIGAKRLAGIAFSQSVKFGLMTAIGTVLRGGDDDDEEDKLNKNVREFVPEWSKKSDLVLVEYGNGKFSYVDFSASDPHGGIKKAYNSFMAGDGAVESFTNGMSEILGPFVKKDMLLESITDVNNNENSYGGKLYNDADTNVNKINAVAERFYKVLEPGSLTSARKIAQAENVGNELAGQLTGYKVITIDVGQQLGFKMNKSKDDIREAKRLYNSAFYKFEDGKMTAEELESNYIQANSAQKEMYKSIMDNMKAASFFGVEDRVIDDAMEGIGKGVINDLWYGDIPDMKQKQVKLTDAEFKAKYGEKIYNQMLRGRELLKKGAK